MSDIFAYHIHEAIKVSGLSRSVLYRLFKAGVIVPRKRGTTTLILASDLQRYLEGLPAAKSQHRKVAEAPVAA